MHYNTIQFLRDGELLASNPAQIDGFRFYAKNQDVVFEKGFKSNMKYIDPSLFLRIANDGNVKLLVRHSASLNKDVPTYGRSTKQQQYSTFVNHYIVTADGNFHKLNSVEDFLSLFSDQKNTLRDYADLNNLDLKMRLIW
jgi:hypothetical protein